MLTIPHPHSTVHTTDRGPAPERSPIRSRFVAPDASLSVVMRNAQNLTFSLTQVCKALCWSGEAYLQCQEVGCCLFYM